MEKLSSILITDRSPADVAARNGKGTYNAEDLNRVLRACSWLAGRLERYGYSVPGEYFPAVLVHVAVEPPRGGSADSVLAYVGETAIVRAVSGDGYEFNHWEENGVTVSEAAEYRFTASSDRDLTAVFDVPATEESGIVGLAAVGRAIVGKEVA